MKIICEESIRNFSFWSGGADRARDIKCDADWDIIESELEALYPDGIEDGQLNDFFWFDFNIIAEWLGYENEEHYFCGAAKDGGEMSDIIIEHFPEANSDAVDEWIDDHWEKCDNEEKCLKAFKKWYYNQYADSYTDWVDRMFEGSEGSICQMKWFIQDKDLNEKTAEEWLDEFNQWLEDEAEWIEEHNDEIYSTDYGF